MLGQFYECEADRSKKYYRVIQMEKGYSDGRKFPLNEIVIADNKIDLEATDITKMGGFCISTYDYMFRWIIRGDTLCEVIVPEGVPFYKTKSKNGIYLADQMILSNPRKLDDDFVMELYKASSLPEISYFIAMTACAICGYMNTALQVCKDKVNKENIDIAIKELEDYCKRREEERYVESPLSIKNVQDLYNKLREIQKQNKK